MIVVVVQSLQFNMRVLWSGKMTCYVSVCSFVVVYVRCDVLVLTGVVVQVWLHSLPLDVVADNLRCMCILVSYCIGRQVYQIGKQNIV